MTEADARSAITDANLTVGPVTHEFSDTIAAGIVISQNPAAGTTVAAGSPVDLIISLGPAFTVPNVVGMTETEANSIITAAGLVSNVTYGYHDTVAVDYVISQDPAGGTDIAAGATVTIVVSLGKPEVPNVVGQPVAAAIATIEGIDNLVTAATYRHDNNVPSGIVISQNPVGGTVVNVGSTVNIVVSLGRPTVPGVVGLSEAEAVATIEAIDNLVAVVDYEYSNTILKDTVMSQDPAGGTDVDVGTAVNIVVSLGEPVVPNVVGRPEAEARTEIEAVDDLMVAPIYVYDNNTPFGIVMSQYPTGGTVVEIGATVNMVVSLGQPEVPGVVGMFQADANAAITAVDNLTVGTITKEYDNTVLADRVISQSPTGGTKVMIGSTVDLVVSLGKPKVPDVVGMTEPNATVAITAVDNLAVGSVTNEYDDTVAIGLVISQNPLAGTEVLIGSTVDFAISLGQPEVPNVVGMTRVDANVAITAVDNLTIGTMVYEDNNTVPAGLIISQNPVGGSIVPVGSLIDLVISAVIVPNVVNMTEADANSAIAAAGDISVGTVAYEYSDTVTAGIVISQDPVGGTLVDIGTQVNIAVSLGRPRVPDVIGRPETDANSAITAVSLLVGNVSYIYSDTVSIDVVIDQNPVGQTEVPVGSTVDLVVSLGQPQVPNVLGMSEPNATAEITSVDNLTVGTVTYQYSDTVDYGRVISQDPSAGTLVPIGSSVDLMASLGKPEVPNVVGDPEATAVAAVEAIDNLVASVVYLHDNTVPAGIVIDQDPVGGTIVNTGTPVTIVVSLGRPVVPSVVGQDETSAVTDIEAIDNLIAIVDYAYHDTVPIGIVISQNPSGDTVVDVGTTVNIVVSLGQATVPYVEGMTEGDANSAIAAAGLTVGTVTYEHSDTVPPGDVMSQSPVAGTIVLVGSPVDLVVSAVTVPNVVDMTKIEANSAITAASLVSNITYGLHDTAAAGFVVSQDPIGGSLAPVNSSVDVFVSLGQPLAVLALGGNRLVELQNDDGGWDSSSVDDGDPSVGSDSETFASVAMGLARAYRLTDDPNMLAAIQKTRTFLLGKTDNFVGTDGSLAVELDGILGGTTGADYVRTNFYDKLEAGTYYDATSDAVHDTNSYVQAQRDRRFNEGRANLAAWDLGLGLYSAHIIGANTTDWVAGVKAEIDELNGNDIHDVLGLAAAVFGLAAVGEDHDPNGGHHAAASSLSDLVETLVSYQLETGGFTWWWATKEEYLDEMIQETVYGLMALNEYDRVGYLSEIHGASVHLQNVQLVTSGWKNYYIGGSEDNQITGEALRGIALAIGQPIVPDVVGRAQADANSAIDAAGLVVGAITYEYDDTMPVGLVASQHPVGGTQVPLWSSVDFALSLGQPNVPYVIDMNEADANSAITATSLIVGSIVYEYNDVVPTGRVISQNPVAGTTVLVGSAVDLVVSLGQGAVVPDIVGTTETNATAAITGEGLTVGTVIYEYSDTVTEWYVISQNPLSGIMIPIGSTVDFIVSLGQPTVPGVVGRRRWYNGNQCTFSHYRCRTCSWLCNVRLQ
jgi:beta-lactam-binding protein with PASTA domain